MNRSYASAPTAKLTSAIYALHPKRRGHIFTFRAHEGWRCERGPLGGRPERVEAAGFEPAQGAPSPSPNAPRAPTRTRVVRVPPQAAPDASSRSAMHSQVGPRGDPLTALGRLTWQRLLAADAQQLRYIHSRSTPDGLDSCDRQGQRADVVPPRRLRLPVPPNRRAELCE